LEEEGNVRLARFAELGRMEEAMGEPMGERDAGSVRRKPLLLFSVKSSISRGDRGRSSGANSCAPWRGRGWYTPPIGAGLAAREDGAVPGRITDLTGDVRRCGAEGGRCLACCSFWSPCLLARSLLFRYALLCLEEGGGFVRGADAGRLLYRFSSTGGLEESRTSGDRCPTTFL
jgi:hypothetical protein